MIPLTDKLREKFTKDCGLPIQIFNEDLFEYYIKELDEQFNSIEKFEIFKKLLHKYNEEEDYFIENESIINNAIEYIKSKDIYNKMCEDDYSKFNYVKNIQKKDIFRMNNINNYYISIDLVKANFQALKIYSKEIVGNKDTYNDFISMFTNEEHFKNSKKIRQVIFGSLNSKEQQIIQRDIMFNIYNKLLENNITSIISVMHDEIIISCKNKDEMDEFKNRINQLNLRYEIRVEAYKLINIEDRKYFVKELDNGKVDFKCVPTSYFIQAYKRYFNKDINENDLFYKDGDELKIFQEPLFKTKDNYIEINR